MANIITRRKFLQNAGSFGAIMLMSSDGFGTKRKILPNILIIGDSISMGYSPFLKEILAEKAYVWHPDENCEGTTKGVLKVDEWIGTTKWDVIHFNFGLHDLKHVNAETGTNSSKPEDPEQANIKVYSKNLKLIIKKLKAANAKLIFATTTPVPEKSTPFRDPEQVINYNRAAHKIMQRQRIDVNDLYELALPKLKEIQITDDVHFNTDGYRLLAEKVSEYILKTL